MNLTPESHLPETFAPSQRAIILAVLVYLRQQRKPRIVTSILVNMLRTRAQLLTRTVTRTYATSTGPHALVFLEHRDGTIDSGSLSALTAAKQLGGEVTGIVVGGPEQLKEVIPKAQK